ncbi:MAG: D-alanine--D-alanine ligase [Desulfobacteraceae bacterium]
MGDRLRVAVLAGGWSREREVSLKSGRAVFSALNRDQYEVHWFDPRDDLKGLMDRRAEIDMAFILLHGRLGEDGRMQGMLDILNIPFVGSGVLSSATAIHKERAKEIFRTKGLNVAKEVILGRGEARGVAEIMATLGTPVVVKPVSEGSSIGMCISAVKEEIEKGIQRAFQFSSRVMVEEYVPGREVTCCVLGNSRLEVLPVVEIRPDKRHVFFDYAAKYTPGATEEICPAPIPEGLRREVERAGRAAHRGLGCAVWSRTDMILRGDRIFVLETNTIPGMTETSLFPLAARGAGWSFSELLDRLITLSLEKEG